MTKGITDTCQDVILKLQGGIQNVLKAKELRLKTPSPDSMYEQRNSMLDYLKLLDLRYILKK